MPRCRYCRNIVNEKSQRANEGICKECADKDRIGNKLQVQLGKECLRRLKNEKIQV